MGRIVKPEASHRPDVLGRKGGQKRPDVHDLVGDVVLAEDVALDDTGLACFADISDTSGQDGIAVVSAAVPGQEADEALQAVRRAPGL